MKYLLIILLFVSCSVIKQQPNIPLPDGFIGTDDGVYHYVSPLEIVSDADTLERMLGLSEDRGVVISRGALDSALKGISPIIAQANVTALYDTTYGIVETYTTDGLFVREGGFVIDSLYEAKLSNEMIQLRAQLNYPLKDTIKVRLKVYSASCLCFLDPKKFYNFIPWNYLQNITIFKDEHISISNN